MRGHEQTLGSGIARKALGAGGVMLSREADPGSRFLCPVVLGGDRRLRQPQVMKDRGYDVTAFGQQRWKISVQSRWLGLSPRALKFIGSQPNFVQVQAGKGCWKTGSALALCL